MEIFLATYLYWVKDAWEWNLTMDTRALKLAVTEINTQAQSSKQFLILKDILTSVVVAAKSSKPKISPWALGGKSHFLI